jgi:hypothetical protein
MLPFEVPSSTKYLSFGERPVKRPVSTATQPNEVTITALQPVQRPIGLMLEQLVIRQVVVQAPSMT